MEIIKREKLTYLTVDAVIGDVILEFPGGTLPALADGQIYILLKVATPNANWGTLPVGVANGDIIERVGGAWTIKITSASRQIGEKVFSLATNLDNVYIGSGMWADSRGDTIGLFEVIQTNAFDIGNVIYYNDAVNAWQLAQANQGTTMGVGMVARADNATFDVIFQGRINYPAHGITPFNTPVYLSTVAAGAVSTSRPSGTGLYIQQVGIALDIDTFIVMFGMTLAATDLGGGGGGGGNTNYEEKLINFTTDAGGGAYMVNTINNPITATLRPTPTSGESVKIHLKDNTNVYTISAAPNQIRTIDGKLVSQMSSDVFGGVAEYIYDGGNTWVMEILDGRGAQNLGLRDIQDLTHTFPDLTPVVRNNTTGKWEVATYAAAANGAEGVVTHVNPTGFDVVSSGYYKKVGHGFNLKTDYYLTDTGGVDPAPGTLEQKVFHTIDVDTIYIYPLRTGQGGGGGGDSTQVGTIRQSFLTETEFHSLDSDGDWVLCDGRSVAGTEYATLTGRNTVPDLRGAYLRMAGQNSTNAAWNGGALNGFQDEQTKMPANPFVNATSGAHQHESGRKHYGPQDDLYAFGSRALGTNGWVSSNVNNLAQYLAKTSTDGDHTHTISGGDPETRPKTYSVNYFIKVKSTNAKLTTTAVSPVTIATTAPAPVAIGQMWLNPDTGDFYVLTNNPNPATPSVNNWQWIQINI